MKVIMRGYKEKNENLREVKYLGQKNNRVDNETLLIEM